MQLWRRQETLACPSWSRELQTPYACRWGLEPWCTEGCAAAASGSFTAPSWFSGPGPTERIEKTAKAIRVATRMWCATHYATLYTDGELRAARTWTADDIIHFRQPQATELQQQQQGLASFTAAGLQACLWVCICTTMMRVCLPYVWCFFTAFRLHEREGNHRGCQQLRSDFSIPRHGSVLRET